jgi:hypothetical protein
MATRALKTVEKAAGDNVGQIIEKMDEQRATNLRLWNVLGKTDPTHTKGFKRAGGFSGTAVKPIWITQRLTELFGPAGIGWGTEEPQFTTAHSQEGEVLVYCTVAGWYRDNGEVARVYGVGGDKAVAWVGKDSYRRMVADDEAFKKAFTDAIGNAFKFVGVAADVHMGLFDDSKYVQEMAAEFHPPKPEVAPKEKDSDWAPTTLKAAIKALIHSLHGCGTYQDFQELMDMPETKEAVEQCRRRFPAWYATGEGMPEEFKPLRTIITETRDGLKQLETQND